MSVHLVYEHKQPRDHPSAARIEAKYRPQVDADGNECVDFLCPHWLQIQTLEGVKFECRVDDGEPTEEGGKLSRLLGAFMQCAVSLAEMAGPLESTCTVNRTPHPKTYDRF